MLILIKKKTFDSFINYSYIIKESFFLFFICAFHYVIYHSYVLGVSFTFTLQCVIMTPGLKELPRVKNNEKEMFSAQHLCLVLQFYQ